MQTIHTLRQHLKRFSALRTADPGDYPWLHRHHGGRHPTTVVFQALTHGDEVGALPALLEVMSALRSGALRFGGEAFFVLGNPEAALKGARFLEQDLNRVFVDPAVAPGGPDCAEVRRAQQLAPLLDACDLFIDFHQTSQPCARPFYSGPWRSDWALWTRAIGGKTAWLARPWGQIYQQDTRCADEYVRDQGKPGLTLELGQRGFNAEATLRAVSEMSRAMALLDGLAGGLTLEAAAAEQPPPDLFEQCHVEAFSDPGLALEPGWGNFAPVRQGQRLSAPGTPERVAPESGFVMHPVYPDREPDGRARAPWPGALYRLVRPVESDPAAVFRRQPPSAPAPASAPQQP